MAWVSFRTAAEVSAPVENTLQTEDNAAFILLNTARGTESRTVAAASSENGSTPESESILFAYGIVLITALVVIRRADTTAPPALDGEALLAVGLFLSQGIERFLEPASRWAGRLSTDMADKTGVAESRSDKRKLVTMRNHAFADAAEDSQRVVIEKKKLTACGVAANKQAATEQFGANASVVLWGLAVTIGLVLALLLDLRLISATGARLDHRLDLILSGIAIGSATKPLHDLITTLSAAKKKNEAAPAGA
jgi:hypothetical protein